MDAARRHFEIRRHDDLHPVRVDQRGSARFDDLLDRLHAGPHARKAAHRKSVDTQVENLLHVSRKKHRKTAGLEDMVALVRGGRTLGHMVVAGHRDHAAPGCGACHVGMLEHIGAAVHARTLAVPDAEHTVKTVRPRWRETQLLGAPDCGGRQFLVHTWLEHDVLCLEVGGRLDQRLVVTAQRRASVTADEPRGVLACLCITLALQHRQLDQGLHATHEGTPHVERIFVVQRDGLQCLADMFRKRRIHGGQVSMGKE